MEKTFETRGHVRLYVQNEVGLITITASETGTTVVSLVADTPGAEELVERAAVECRSAGGGHVVAVKVPRLHGMRFVRRNAVTVRVEVPEGSDVTVAAGSADVEITGTIGSADLKSASGDISTDDVAARVTAKTASGNVTLGAVGGDLRCPERVGATSAAPASPGPPSSRPPRVIWRSAPPATGWRSKVRRGAFAWAS